ncbi:MAG: hypothetical protein L3J41_11610 [Melioribacteraceae bacterium]|nr:hypothetical protein [Melioribacteraceae bacterium]
MKINKNRILIISIAIMVVVATLAASHTPINWNYFILSVVILTIVIWLQKRDLKKILTESENNGLPLNKFEELLNTILLKLDEVSKNEIDEKYSNKLFSIMDETMPDIDEYRIAMINQYGITNYTQISIPFAKAERLINRGVSTAIDGYYEESQKNISNSLEFLELSIKEIEKIKVGNNG